VSFKLVEAGTLVVVVVGVRAVAKAVPAAGKCTVRVHIINMHAEETARGPANITGAQVFTK